nr:HEPN domain-containing protein [Mycobacterium aquaticum]
MTMAEGSRAAVVLDGPVVDEVPPPVSAADSALDVAAFQPITIHGRLDSGVDVTLVNAQNYQPDSGQPRYEAHQAIVGAHVSGADQLYTGVRYQLGHLLLGHLPVGVASVVPDDGSRLSADPAEDGEMWLVYEAATPMTLRQLHMRVVSGCLVLLRLALDQPVAIRACQVRVNEGDPWLTVHSQTYSAPTNLNLLRIVEPAELTLNQFAEWIALNDKLDGLAWPVVEPINGAVQARAQVYTTLVEGLHRRLPYEQSQFPAAQPKWFEKIRQAARRAAKEWATKTGNLDPGAVHTAVNNALAHFDAVGYADRARALVSEVTAAVPELTESVPDLSAQLTRARNELSHHPIPDEEKEPLGDRVLRWAIVAEVAPWLLRVFLLLHAGIDPVVLRAGLLEHERFDVHRANVAQMVADLGWPPPRPAQDKPDTADAGAA